MYNINNLKRSLLIYNSLLIEYQKCLIGLKSITFNQTLFSIHIRL